MFDEHQSRKPAISITPSVITIACAGGGMLLSFGLCGATTLIPGPHLPILQSLGVLLFGLSVLAIIVSVAWFVIVIIANAFRD